MLVIDINGKSPICKFSRNPISRVMKQAINTYRKSVLAIGVNMSSGPRSSSHQTCGERLSQPEIISPVLSQPSRHIIEVEGKVNG